jgi:hypothetical protein
VSDTTPRNNLGWRVTVLERQIQALQEGKPDVIAERVGMMALRLAEIQVEMRERDSARERQIRGFQRIFVGVFTGVGVAITGAVVAIILTGGAP